MQTQQPGGRKSPGALNLRIMSAAERTAISMACQQATDTREMHLRKDHEQPGWAGITMCCVK